MNLPEAIQTNLRSGGVIPAHPLAVTDRRKLDECRQRALTRYYLASGASGVAVGVHTTQFQIRDPRIDLLKPVLQLASETVDEFEERHPQKSIIRIAGICGRTDQALREAELAQELGYHLGLLSLSAFRDDTIDQMIRHAEAVGEIIPLMGFYLQPSVGGRLLGFDFWSRFCEIPSVCAIKIAPFNRYQTLDVIRAVAETGRAGDIALYTGNDDNIVADLLTEFQYQINGNPVNLRFAGGLLGHWAVWTRRVVLDFEQITRCSRSDNPIPNDLLTLGAQITDCNAAFFDPPNRFAGCIAGIHEVLRRQGLMQNRLCLDPNEDLSPGQLEEIDRVYAAYPRLNDDAFIAEHLAEWLA
ncbi:MAG: dihydrodipicolinate synthase family protein [Candidatus Hinthialibacter sp.]